MYYVLSKYFLWIFALNFAYLFPKKERDVFVTRLLYIEHMQWWSVYNLYITMSCENYM